MKLFSKIATLALGAAMAVGVGVAVGSKAVSEAKAGEETASFTLSSADEVTVDSVTASFAKGSGSNAPAWYAAGLRLYASNTVTISSSDTITGVSFNWQKQGNKAFNTVTANVGDYTHPSAAGTGTWTGSANEIVFTLGSSGQLQLNTFSVTYETGGSSATLESIEVTGSMNKKSYTTADSWDPTGFVVTAYYDDESSKDVTSNASWTYSPASPTLTTTSVVATATFGEKSASSSAQTVSVTRTNPIQAIYTKASGASVDVYGYYVGFLDGTGPVIMDGDYGIVVYNKSADVSGYTVNETILHVTGTVSIYKGLYEIGSPTISVASGTYDAPDTPVVYATAGGETAEYASRLTTVTGTATVASGSFDSDAGTADITMNFTVGSKTVQVFYKKAAQTADADAFAAMKQAVTDGTEITIKGFTGWYNGFQVQMNGYIPAAVDYTAEDFAQDLLDQTDAVCAGYEEGDNKHDALVAIWSNLASNDKYPSLPSAEKTKLAEAERVESGTVVEQAMARYDFLTGKYSLSNFINGRTPIVPAGSYLPSYENNLSSSSSIAIIVIVAVASMTLLGVTLVIRKRKMN